MNTYHAPHFDPTVDELETLKQLEMGKLVDTPQALKEHLSGRLYERGYISKNSAGQLTITDLGRTLIRRQDN
jgi:predicted transcriptional regulator